MNWDSARRQFILQASPHETLTFVIEQPEVDVGNAVGFFDVLNVKLTNLIRPRPGEC